MRSGRLAGVWWCLISLCQFHVPFYSTRLLPNSLALVLVNLGAAEWLLQDRPARVVALFAFTSVSPLASSTLHVAECWAAPLTDWLSVHARSCSARTCSSWRGWSACRCWPLASWA